MAAELLFVAAQDDDMPRFLRAINPVTDALLMSTILVSFIIYAPATILFVMARREQGMKLFSTNELVILTVPIAGAVLGVVALATGWITI